MKIDLVALRRSINDILDHVIDEQGIREVELTDNYYWEVPSDVLYAMDDKPKEFDVGSLFDDWELLSSSTTPLANQLAEIAPLFHYLGHKLGKQLASEGG